MQNEYENLFHTNIKPIVTCGSFDFIAYVHKGHMASAIRWQYKHGSAIAIDIDDADISSAKTIAKQVCQETLATYAQLWQSSELQHYHLLLSDARIASSQLHSLLSKYGDAKYANVVCNNASIFALRVSALNGFRKQKVAEIGAPWLASDIIKAHQWLCELANGL